MTTPPVNPDLTMLYALVTRMDEKIDNLSGSMFQTFVPRTEIDSRFGELQKQLDRQTATLKWAIGAFLTLIGVIATVLGIIYK